MCAGTAVKAPEKDAERVKGLVARISRPFPRGAGGALDCGDHTMAIRELQEMAEKNPQSIKGALHALMGLLISPVHQNASDLLEFVAGKNPKLFEGVLPQVKELANSGQPGSYAALKLLKMIEKK